MSYALQGQVRQHSVHLSAYLPLMLCYLTTNNVVFWQIRLPFGQRCCLSATMILSWRQKFFLCYDEIVRGNFGIGEPVMNQKFPNQRKSSSAILELEL